MHNNVNKLKDDIMEYYEYLCNLYMVTKSPLEETILSKLIEKYIYHYGLEKIVLTGNDY